MTRKIEKAFYKEINTTHLNLEKYKTITDIFANISELVFSGGMLMLDMINRGNIFDLDDDDEKFKTTIHKLEENIKKHNFVFNRFFSDMVFLILTSQRGKVGIEELIYPLFENNLQGEELVENFLTYKALIMISEFRIPWEIKYVLNNYIKVDVSAEDIFKEYIGENETYTMCINRYQKN